RYQAADAPDFAVVEEWPNLSMEAGADYIVDRVNHPFSGSRFVTVQDLSGAGTSGEKNPAVLSSEPLHDGTEHAPSALDFVGDAALKTGLFALDTARVQLLAVPDAHTFPPAGRRVVVQGALNYCERRGDCMFVGAAPDRTLAAGVTTPRNLRDY